jgi:hypothetical protein
MSAELVGLEKIVRYLERYDFQKIKLSRGVEAVYLKRSADGENKDTLIADFADWVENFIQPDNYKEYRLELFGTYKTEPEAKLSPVVKVTVQFNQKGSVGATEPAHRLPAPTNPIDVDKYVSMAVELASVKAQNERLEEKLDELLEEMESEEPEMGAPEPKNIGEAVNQAIMGKADKIIDALLMYFTASQGISSAQPINGVENTLEEFRVIHPEIDADLERLLVLAKNRPDFFKMLIAQLRNIV